MIDTVVSQDIDRVSLEIPAQSLGRINKRYYQFFHGGISGFCVLQGAADIIDWCLNPLTVFNAPKPN